jgi:inner membrane transporter RhtA
MCLEPAIAVTVGLVLLGQVPRAWSLAGVAFVIAAGLGAQRHGARTAPESAASGADDADMSALCGVIAPETADISGC